MDETGAMRNHERSFDSGPVVWSCWQYRTTRTTYREAGLMADAARGHAIGRRWRTHGQWDSSVKERSPA